MIRVKVRSPSPFAQAGLENAISADPRFEIVTGDVPDLNDRVDVLLVDSSEVETQDPATPVVWLTDVVHPSAFTRLSRQGIRGFLARDSSVQEITAALEAASEDLTVIAPEFLQELLPAASTSNAHSDQALPEPLTSRERQVLALLAEGAGNKEIAAKLAISENTAKFHVSSILGKLGAETRTEAVTRGYRLGLIFI